MVPRSDKGKHILNQASLDTRDMGVGLKGLSSDGSKDMGRRKEMRPDFGGGITILQRGSDARPGAWRVIEDLPSLVERCSRDEGGVVMLRTSRQLS